MSISIVQYKSNAGCPMSTVQCTAIKNAPFHPRFEFFTTSDMSFLHLKRTKIADAEANSRPVKSFGQRNPVALISSDLVWDGRATLWTLKP